LLSFNTETLVLSSTVEFGAIYLHANTI